MEILILRIIEKLLIIYFGLYFIIDLGLYFYSFIVFSTKSTKLSNYKFSFDQPISIIVPAYNEEISIVHCIKMLLQLDYPNFQIIVVNDGSRDKTLQLILDNFSFFKTNESENKQLITKQVLQNYISQDGKIMLIDKENGGKADSINAGINVSAGTYICTIDADSILDTHALKEVAKPFMLSDETIVSGGQLAASNDLVLADNKVISSKVPTNLWVLWQIIEYIKSFMISRIGLSRINALLIMSGAFSMFRRSDLIEIGGFLTKDNDSPYIVKTIGIGKQTVCEDMEIVVRLWQYKRSQKLKAKAVFIPEPVCWTEVPDNGKNIFKQRSRWHQGLAETLKIHGGMIFEPKYGITGMIGIPYYFFFELLSPLVKIFSIFFLITASAFGIINLTWVILLITSVMIVTAIILSSITAIIENWSQKAYGVNREALRYKTFFDWIKLILAGILAEFSYSFFKIVAQMDGLYKFVRKKNEWNKFSRKGLKEI